MTIFSIVSIIGSRSGAPKEADLCPIAKDAPNHETTEELNDVSLVSLKNDSWLMEARLGIIMVPLSSGVLVRWIASLLVS